MQSTIDKTLDHVLFLARHMCIRDIRGAVTIMLLEMGVPTKIVGFEYIRYAIVLQRNNPTRSLANDIYAEICLHYGHVSEEQVEQAIMNAIKMAWQIGKKEAWEWYFSYGGKGPNSKPSNSEFISRLACILELWQECKEGGSQ